MINNLSDLEKIREECYAMVTTRASVSAGTSAIPTPGVDLAADVAILMEMLPAINKKFGLDAEQIAGYSEMRKQIIFQAIKRSGVALVGQLVTKTLVTQVMKKVAGRIALKQVLKFVPFAGWAANAAIGFGAMKYIGNSHVDDCFNICKSVIDQSRST